MTFLFTDVEGSTRLWEAHPDLMPAVLAQHDALLRAAVEAGGGTVVKSTGDGTLAAFADATAAVQVACEAQRSLSTTGWAVDPFRVRMGLHTGVADERDGDYFGSTLNRAARLMAVGHGGQVLVSDATQALDTAHAFIDLGVHALRDLSRPQHVFQLFIDGLRSDFPALRSLDTAPTNLPPQLTSFVGRVDEVAMLADLVRGHRLVTVTGVGGVGKTRIALQVAAELLGEFVDGAWICELAAAQDAESLLQVVTVTLGAARSAGNSGTETVTAFLRSKVALLILDNCEHLLDCAAELADAVLEWCPHVRVLATSREVLGIGGEQVFGLRSLSMGGDRDDAGRLFAERARSVRPDFQLDDTNAASVAEICRRLDGIPLAIELAAARVLAMQPYDIELMLDERFRLLTGGKRAKLERHQTLRATVDWSYSLLAETERMVFERLSVFPASFDVDAATAVATGGGVEVWDVVDALMTLVAKSMLTLEGRDTATRYQLLETMRQYGVERLAERAAPDDARRVHAAYFADLAEREGRLLVGRDEIAARHRLFAEVDNLRAAVSWALDADTDADALLGLRIVAGVALLVTSARSVGVGAWAERAAQRADIADHPVRLTVLGAAAFGASNVRGDQAAARGYAERALRDGLTAEASAGVLAAAALAVIDMNEGRLGEAIAGLRHAIAELDALGDDYGAVTLRAIVPIFLGIGGQFEAAIEESRAATRLARTLGNPTALVTALFAEGLAHVEDHPEHALAVFEESLALTAAGASDIVYSDIQEQCIRLRTILGDLRGAVEALRTGFEHAVGDGNRLSSITLLWYGLEALVPFGELEFSAVLFGAVDDGCGGVAPMLNAVVGPQAVRHTDARAEARAALGADRFDELVARGATMTYDDVVTFARRELERAIA